jgi:hypothetical protein
VASGYLCNFVAEIKSQCKTLKLPLVLDLEVKVVLGEVRVVVVVLVKVTDAVKVVKVGVIRKIYQPVATHPKSGDSKQMCKRKL